MVLDGATGTALADLGLWAADYGGEQAQGCHEALLLHRPEVILQLHRGYALAGADILKTDSFGGTPIVLAEYGLGEHTLEINTVAAALARRVAAEAEAKDGQARWVAGSIGPTTRSLTLTGGVTFSEMVAAYALQVEGLAQGGADILLIETVQDALNLKAALIAGRQAAPRLPVAVSATMEPSGTTLGGQTIEAIAAIAAPWEPLWLGINCSTGPGPMTEHVRALAAVAPCPVAVCPNAGLPDPEGRYLETPEEFSRAIERFAAAGWVNLLGGCCGTSVDHVRALRAVADRHLPRPPAPTPPARLAGCEAVEIRQSPAPLLIGERTNALGSKRFRELARSGRFAEAAEIGRRQVRGGAHVLDVCLADPEADEGELTEGTLRALRRAVRVPLVIDSTDPAVIARALELIPGRPAINSVNLEDGGIRLEEVARLARRFGAAVVAGCIDEHPSEGMARTAERKLEVATRLLARLGECGIPPADVLVDPLVFPAASGDARFAGAAAETVRGVRLVKERFPDTHTLLGISNVSFGLPTAGREVLNAVFLHHCVRAGLDAAIVNTEQLVRFPAIAAEEVALAEAVLFEGSEAAIAAFAARFQAARRQTDTDVTLPAEERLRRMIVDGRRSGLEVTLDELLERMDPLAIVNGPLLAGMDEVGRLFGSGQLIVAEVLVSAEVMQAAVEYLQPHLGTADLAGRGSLLLATVRGDVHDIGKNLVNIVFSSNGYRVVDLGVQCPSDRLVAAWQEHRTDLIGLSGLLVRSAQQMAATAADLTAAGISVPLLVGGAALSGAFTRQQIAPAYAGEVRYVSHAMAGLTAAQELLRSSAPPEIGVQRLEASAPAHRGDEAARAREEGCTRAGPALTSLRAGDAAEPSGLDGAPSPTALAPPSPSHVPPPPDYVRHVLPELPLDDVFSHLNWQMLLGKHLGVRGVVKRLLEAHDVRAEEVARRVEALQDAAAARQWLQPSAVFQFYRAIGCGDNVVVLDPAGREIAVLPFARQAREPHACAADWVSPDPAARDTVALFVTTAGSGVEERAAELRSAGCLADSIALQALALETAEAAAEWLHRRLRTLWGFPDPPEMTMEERFRAAYRGIRLSFGYPACPALEPQVELFRLLEPDLIGVHLTESYMMAPEASVSAVVFHHPEGRYLS